MAADANRLAAALDYLERIKRQAVDFGGGVASNLAERAKSAGGLAFEALTSDPNIGRMTTAEFSQAAADRQTPRLDQAAQDLATISREIVTQPIQTGKAIVQGEIERAQGAMQSPRAAGEYAGSFIDPVRMAAALRKAGPVMAELDVYHGTPHRFPATEANPLGEFDASKIGTGEGAQAYGHGIYYAENPDVAKGYQSTLRETNAWEIDGQRVHGVRSRSDAQPINYAANALERFDGDKKAAIAWLKDSESPWDLEAAQLLAKSKTAQKAPGSLYKADLPDEMIDRMLDWDKPIKDQPEAVRKAIDRIESEFSMRKQPYKDQEGTGFWYGALTDTVGGQQNASKLLKEYGVPGIKYLDAGSRDGRSGTRNFVVFPGEEKKVRILERDGQKAPPQKIAQALETVKPENAEPQPFGKWGYSTDQLRRTKQNFTSQYGLEEGKRFTKDYEVIELNKLRPTEKTDENKVQSLMKAMVSEGNAKDTTIPPIIVDSMGNILDGHNRYEAAKRLEAKFVPVIELFDEEKGPMFAE